MCVGGGGGGGGVGKYRMTSLYNQFLTQFISNQSEDLHGCCRHIGNVHLLFFKKETRFFDKFTNFSNLDISANSG